MTAFSDLVDAQSDILSILENRLHLENLLSSGLITRTDEEQ